MENYFRNALQNFILEEAGGGAIRHLANRGYPARQIAESLSFPVPYEKVREVFTKHLLDSGILLKEKPAGNMRREKIEYVREYDRYGKPSFRKVTVSKQCGSPEKSDSTKDWEEMDFSEFLLLYKSGEENIKIPEITELAEAERSLYISCDFGQDPEDGMLKALERGQQEYIQGICWTKRRMYHLLDKRMLEISVKLAEEELPVGKIYVRRSGKREV